MGYYVSSSNGGNKIRKIDLAGVITTYAGTGAAGYSGDGMPATLAKLYIPTGLVLDASENLYFADAGNNAIRRIDKLTGIITTVAGNGTGSFGGDGSAATAAMLFDPQDICFDRKGNLYIADYYNYRVRKVDVSGIITTIAGVGSLGYGGDSSLADTSKIGEIVTICSDTFNNIYIGDNINSRIFKIDTFGFITTFAGTDTGYIFNGDAIPATAANINPNVMRFDDTGNLYVAVDEGSSRVRKITTTGYIYTVAGDGSLFHSGDGGPATAAGFNNPDGIAFDACGNLYVPEGMAAGYVRKISFYPSCDIPLTTTNVKNNTQIFLYPNPAYSQLTITSATNIHEVTITNLIGQQVLSQVYDMERAEVNVSGLPPGVYVVRVRDEDGNVVVRKVVKE